MKLQSNIFREYDIRGVTGKELDEGIVERVGKAVAVYLRGKKTHNCMAVARDGRLTSKAYANAVIDGLTSCGVNVIDLGETSTGVLYFGLFTLDVDGGIMITGSHNPKDYNGMKIAIGKSTIHGAAIQRIRAIIEKGKFPKAKGPVTITRMDIVPDYRKRIAQDVKLKKKMKVVVDAGNGVGGRVAVPLLEKMGCTVIPLFCEVDGNFPNHHPDPTVPSSLRKLMAVVKKTKADIGIAFDGDADRIGVVDRKGRYVPGDLVLLMLARGILKEVPGATVIGEVKCSRVLYEGIEAAGGKAIMYKAGHSLIKAEMAKRGALIGGEMSGHMFFKHRWYGFDCAIYATARFLEFLAASGKSLSAHIDALPKMYATDEIRIDTTDAKKFKIVEKATKYFKAQGYTVNTIDGARIEFEDGWGLLRASNTQPALVMRAEAESKKRLKEISAIIEDKIAELN